MWDAHVYTTYRHEGSGELPRSKKQKGRRGSPRFEGQGAAPKEINSGLKDLRQNFDVRFSSISFVLSRFGVSLSDGSSKTPQHMFSKEIVAKSEKRKELQSNRQKK
jgi:hypothetical protein